MTWIPTPESTNLAGFGYESTTKVLTVEFKASGKYNYYDVPQQVFDQMKAAPSRGQFHAQYVKGRYRYARV